MGKTLGFEVSEEVYIACQEMAERQGRAVEDLVLEFLASLRPKGRAALTEEEVAEARRRLSRYAGAVSLGSATDMQNREVDADILKGSGEFG